MVVGCVGVWSGGREKAPAAFCRKALTAMTEFEMWGDGKQTRSFTFIDDCVEGILRFVRIMPLSPPHLRMSSFGGRLRRVSAHNTRHSRREGAGLDTNTTVRSGMSVLEAGCCFRVGSALAKRLVRGVEVSRIQGRKLLPCMALTLCTDDSVCVCVCACV